MTHTGPAVASTMEPRPSPGPPVVALEIAPLGEATKLIVENHYLKRGRTMAQIAYWITLGGERCGVLLFALPRLSVRTSKFGSHSPMQLVELARMWIDPTFQGRSILDARGNIHSLPIASMAISRAVQRVRQDWYGKYPHLPEPRAVVAWSDITLHEGTIYRAANFRYVGRSGGVGHRNTRRPTGGRDQLRADYLNVKDAFTFPFARHLSATQKVAAHREWDGQRPKPRNRPATVDSSFTDRNSVSSQI